MPLTIKKLNGKYRLVNRRTKRIEKFKTGTLRGRPVDAGGHPTRERAARQLRAINLVKNKAKK